jgi:hypothetical protein
MGQQLHIRYKRQRRKQWVDRKKKADKAKAGKVQQKPAVAKTENSAAPAEPKAGN